VIKGCPAIVTYAVGSQKLVFDYSPELEGLQKDMPLQQVLSRHGDVELLQVDIPYYWSIFNEVLDAMQQKSPLVEGSELGNIYVDVDGLQLIHKNDNAMFAAVREAMPEGFSYQMGMSANKFLAYLAAQHSSPGGYRLLAEDVDSFLRDLPCDVLPVSVKSRDKLHDFGLHTLGQVATLLKGPIQAQFGPEGRKIWELARGYDDTTLNLRFTDEIIEESTSLASVTVSLEAILVEVETLLYRFFARNDLKGRGIYGLTLWTRGWSSEHWERNIKFKEPAIDVRTIISRIRRVTENYPQPGPVEQVGIKINRLGYSRGRQKSLFSEVRARDHLLEDIRQLELRQGNAQVFKVKEVEPWSRIPERRYKLTPTSR
jgi:DNA polymerase-4/protein ImuB